MVELLGRNELVKDYGSGEISGRITLYVGENIVPVYFINTRYL